MNETARPWSRTLRIIHWLMAGTLLANIYVGWYADGLPRSMAKLEWFLIHKSLGITLLALVVIRIAVRSIQGRPAEHPMPRWQATASRLSHLLLYVLMIMVPLAGWWLNSVSNYSLSWFGLFQLPSIAPHNDELHSLAESIHVFAAWTLLALIGIHALAALKHHFVDRNDVLRAMLFGKRSR